MTFYCDIHVTCKIFFFFLFSFFTETILNYFIDMIVKIFNEFGVPDASLITVFIEDQIQKRPHDFLGNSLDAIEDIWRTKRSRVTRPRGSLWDSVWGQLLRNPNLAVANSNEAKSFRRRFRVPYDLFRDILIPLCEKHNVFRVKKRTLIPVEFRLLIALRIITLICFFFTCKTKRICTKIRKYEILFMFFPKVRADDIFSWCS